MTAIAGIVDDGIVYMSADSAGVAGMSMEIRADEKIFINGPFLISITSSFRMGNILQYKFNPPIKNKKQSTMHFMVNDFVDRVRDCFKSNGFATTDKGQENGGTFLVGFNGRLFIIYDDFQVAETINKIAAAGCARDICCGSLYSTVGKPPQDRLFTAMSAAEHYSSGVRRPFIIKKLAMPISPDED